MIDLLRANIVMLSPIILLSVITVAIIVNRLSYFFSIRLEKQEQIDSFLMLWNQGNARELALQLEKNHRSLSTRLLRYAVRIFHKETSHSFPLKLEAYALKMLGHSELYINSLSGISNVATLMGLFGTVTGMIVAFSEMQTTGSSDPYTLAGGISQALVTTAAGLTVAIPGLLFHSFFNSLIDKQSERMQVVIREVVAQKRSGVRSESTGSYFERKK